PPKTPAAKPPGPLQARIDATLEQVSPSVVTLWYGKPPRHVTGTIVTPDGLVVTCAHLSRKAGDPVEVRLADGRKVRGKVLAKLADGRKIRRGRDLALVQIIPKGPWPAVALGLGDTLTSDDPVLAVGSGDTGLYGPSGTEPPRYVRLGRRLGAGAPAAAGV